MCIKHFTHIIFNPHKNESKPLDNALCRALFSTLYLYSLLLDAQQPYEVRTSTVSIFK